MDSRQEDIDAASVLASLASHSPTSFHSKPPPTFGNSPSTSLNGTSHSTHHITSPTPPQSHIHHQPAPPDTQPDIQPTPVVKEDSGEADPSFDQDTAAMIAAASNEHGMRVRKPTSKPLDYVATPDLDAPELSQKAPSKKRAAPTEGRKPPFKKRKSEAPSDRDTPASNRQSSPADPTIVLKPAKPTLSKKSKSSKAKAATSKALESGPRARSFSPDPEDSEVSDPDSLYCICRKPDNHKFMIGCDGGCDDWFHGKCVHVRKEDEPLIDKFICPNCSDKGKGVTTWKPMCRRGGCRNPARLKKGSESKYCSKACGVDFMKTNLTRSAGQRDQAEDRPRKRHKNNDGVTVVAEEHITMGPLGGAVGPPELKALTDASSNATAFRQLGSDPLLTPPPSASQDEVPAAMQPDFTESEKMRLGEIESRKTYLRQQRLLYKDRETFYTMMKARLPFIKEKLEMKSDNQPCCFDPVWSLSDIEFKEWREGEEGKAIYDRGDMDIPENLGEEDCRVCPRVNIPRKRCGQHGNWQQLILRDVRFESGEIGREMRIIDAEDKDIRIRALRRPKDSASNAPQAGEGWVEMVEDTTPAATPDPRPLVQSGADVEMTDDMRPAYEGPRSHNSPTLDNTTRSIDGPNGDPIETLVS